MAARRPNIALLVMDPARRDHVSCYGSTRETMPRLADFAEEGCVYQNAFTVAPWTPPSHASMFTGLYPGSHGVDHGHLYLERGIPTIAGTLTDAGYETVNLTNNSFVGYATGLDRGFSTVEEKGDVNRWRFLRKRVARAVAKARDGVRDAGASHSIRWVRKWLRRRDSTRPFFLFINFLEPHLPYTPPRRFVERFGEPKAIRPMVWRVGAEGGADFLAGAVEFGEEDLHHLAILYDAELAYLDTRLDELFNDLRAAGVLDDTVVMVTSDHGENLGDYGMIDHQYCLYDTLVRIPLIIRYPEVFDRGSSVEGMVENVDFVPSILKLTGVEAGEMAPQGRSLLPDDVESHARGSVFAEYARPQATLAVLHERYPSFDTAHLDRGLVMVREARYKLIQATDGSEELYDLQTDAGEKANLVGELPEVAARLRANLAQWKKADAPVAEAEDHAFDARTLSMLEELGYL